MTPALVAATATTSTKPRRRTASMWWAPTNPGPTRPIPMRVIRTVRPAEHRPAPPARVSGARGSPTTLAQGYGGPPKLQRRRKRLRRKGGRPRSGERLLRVLVTFPDLFDGRALAAVFVLDIGPDRPAFLFQQLQHVANRRLALSPGRVVALILFAILQMQIGDVGVVLAN